MSPIKRCLATLAIATSLFAPVAQANDALEAKVRAYVPVVSLAKVCDIRIKADWKPYAQTKKMLQTEQSLAKENAETNGWNVTEETTAVTEQFCAAVKTR